MVKGKLIWAMVGFDDGGFGLLDFFPDKEPAEYA